MPRLPIRDMPDCLRQLLAQVPAGRVTTYGALADAIVRRMPFGRRLPEFLYWVERRSRIVAR